MRNSLKLLEELGAVECKWREGADDEFKLEEPKAPEPADEMDPQNKSCRDLEVNSELTALGFHLATLPVDPRYVQTEAELGETTIASILIPDVYSESAK